MTLLYNAHRPSRVTRQVVIDATATAKGLFCFVPVEYDATKDEPRFIFSAARYASTPPVGARVLGLIVPNKDIYATVALHMYAQLHREQLLAFDYVPESRPR